MQEFSLIEKFFKPLTKQHKAACGLADDAAKISLKKDEELVISKDIFVENVHFLLRDGGYKIASKLLRTNLSDLAASGAKPLYYVLGFSKNSSTNTKFLTEFTKGLKSVQDEFGLVLIGGDTVSSKQLFFSVTIFGLVKKDKILSRNKAKDGDLIFLSGSVGDAGIGLKINNGELKNLNKKDSDFLLNRHFFPTPRIELGKKLLEKKLSSCAIDISDGLLADLNHICKASKLNAEVFLEQIAFSKAALKSNPEPLDLMSSGDDYELIFTASKKNYKKIIELGRSLNLEIRYIGEFKKSDDKKFEIILRDKNLQKIKIKKLGYEH